MPKKENNSTNDLISCTDPKKYDNKGEIVYPNRLGKKVDSDNFRTIDDLGKFYDSLDTMMIELMEYFEVDKDHPNRWRELAYRLAYQHVPSFQVKLQKKSGRPKIRHIKDDVILFKSILLKKSENPEWTYSTASTHIHNQKLFSQYSSKESLYTRFMEIKRKVNNNPEYKEQFLPILHQEIMIDTIKKRKTSQS